MDRHDAVEQGGEPEALFEGAARIGPESLPPVPIVEQSGQTMGYRIGVVVLEATKG